MTKKKFFSYFGFFFILILILELSLRILGFGDPLIYKNNNNYFPKANQDIRRFKGSKVIINNLGMRSNDEWVNEKKHKKILFFGDSVTYGGSYIDNNELFTEKLCILIKNYLCGNYGVNGYKIQNISNRIKNISNKINFNKLIIVVSNNIEDGKSNFHDFPFYEKFDSKFLRSTTEILNHILFKYKIKNNYHKNEKINSKNVTIKSYITDFSNTLNQLNKKNVKIFLFIIPSLENLDSNNNSVHFLEKLNLNYLKTFNMFQEIKNSDYRNLYFNNAHFNKKGHDYFAKIMYDKIK